MHTSIRRCREKRSKFESFTPRRIPKKTHPMNSSTVFTFLVTSLLLLGCTTINEKDFRKEVFLTRNSVQSNAIEIQSAQERLYQNLDSLFGEKLLEFNDEFAVIAIHRGVFSSQYEANPRAAYVRNINNYYSEIKIEFDRLVNCEIRIQYSTNMRRTHAKLILRQKKGYSGPLRGYGGRLKSVEEDLPILKEICSDFMVMSDSMEEVIISSEN